VFAHGFLTVGGKKMSKTNLTGIHPFQLTDRFGTDSYRYCFLRETRFGEDGNFSWEAMVDRHNADLANGLGNLASRVLAMLASSFDGVVPEATVPGAQADLPAVIEDAGRRLDEHVLALQLQPALVAIWDVVGRANGYLVEQAPWSIAKDPARREEVASILYAAAETLRVLAIMISPVMPGAAERLWEQLGIAEPLHAQRVPADLAWGGLVPGTVTTKGGALFPRLDPD
jgi:methionyl-tRNA synthetase